MKAAPLVYIYGDEPFLLHRALREVEQEALVRSDPSLNRQVFEAPAASAGEVMAAAQSLPFLGDRRLVVVRDAHRWSADDWKPLLSYLNKPNPSTCLVFMAEQLDRRNKAGKTLASVARLVECPRPREGDMPDWVQRLAKEANLTLHPRIMQSLLLRIGPDLQVLEQEIEKLRLVADENGTVSEEDLQALVGENRGTTVFIFCNALGVRDLGESIKALRKLLQLGEAPVKLLYMVARHLRQVWIGWELAREQRRVDRKRAASAMGVPPFAVDGILKQAECWGEKDLRRALALVVRADLALKSGGGDEVLEKLLLDLCGPKKNARPRSRERASLYRTR